MSDLMFLDQHIIALRVFTTYRVSIQGVIWWQRTIFGFIMGPCSGLEKRPDGVPRLFQDPLRTL